MRKPRKRFLYLVGTLFLILAVIFVAKTASFYPFLFQVAFNKSISLKESNNRINVLLLGIGGGTHDGPNLTDTIMLASIDPKLNKVTLVSIPRDLWYPPIKQKINDAYADGVLNGKGGLSEAEAAVGKITGQTIDYGIRLDFSGFVQAVNIVGGLDINVDNTFDDYQYPIDGQENNPCGHTQAELAAVANDTQDQLVQDFPCRYKHVHFNKGLQHMDGETALEYVRSRHAVQAIEASDFARSKRQEKVIKAFKDKVFSIQTLLNPGKLISLYDTLKSSIDMDIPQSQFDDFIRLAEKMKNAKIQTAVIDTGDPATQRAGLLINPPTSSAYDYEWVLTPRIGNGNFSEIQNYVSCEIAKGNCVVSPSPQTPKP